MEDKDECNSQLKWSIGCRNTDGAPLHAFSQTYNRFLYGTSNTGGFQALLTLSPDNVLTVEKQTIDTPDALLRLMEALAIAGRNKWGAQNEK